MKHRNSKLSVVKGRELLVGRVESALSDGSTRGGHLLEGWVFPTLEAIVSETTARLAKVMRPEIGDPAH